MGALNLRVVSFGYGHNEPPPADITIDVRDWFRDPHVSPELRNMTGLDPAVRTAVVRTDGVVEFITHLFSTVRVLAGLNVRPVTVAVGCVGGRHRSVVIGELLAQMGRLSGWGVELSHRDVREPVLARRVPAGSGTAGVTPA